ncbi:MAG: D-hexose-6-phosphate mutarotase, partial [Mariprofundaceae bacterium]
AIALQGAQVTAFQPRGQEPVFWTQAGCRFEAGSSMRSGIPVCWPWFGPHPSDAGKPAHGFVRTALLTLKQTQALADGSTQIRFGLRDDEATQALWPHAFELELIATVGPELCVELRTRNSGGEAFTITEALHTYFSVADVTKVSIQGLDGCGFIDKLDDQGLKLQSGAIEISAETDRVYLDTTADCTIEDPGLHRLIRIAKAGSHSTVVWNPWVAKAANMGYAEGEYLGMLCVETANADKNVVTVPPASEHCMQFIISVEPLA